MIDSRQIRYFVAVAQDLHFARAADRLHIAQSALSSQIKRLEADLGVKLLNRNKRAAASLTLAGELFLAEAMLTVRQLERAEQVGKAAARGVLGRVALGYIGSAVISGLLSTLLKLFHEHHPEIRMDVVAMETPKQLEALSQGRIDLALIRPRPIYEEGIRAKVIHREHLLLALPAKHHLALGNGSVRADQLISESFIVPQFNENVGFAENLLLLGRLGGFEVDIAYRVNDFMTVLSLVAGGYGIALVPESMQAFSNIGVEFLRVEGLNDEVELAIAYSLRTRSPAVLKLLEIAVASGKPR